MEIYIQGRHAGMETAVNLRLLQVGMKSCVI